MCSEGDLRDAWPPWGSFGGLLGGLQRTSGLLGFMGGSWGVSGGSWVVSGDPRSSLEFRGVPGGLVGVPWASLGGLEASLGVAVFFNDRFLVYA